MFTSLEKKAAYDTLIQEGYDFDTATDLVKQASIKTPLLMDASARHILAAHISGKSVDPEAYPKLIASREDSGKKIFKGMAGGAALGGLSGAALAGINNNLKVKGTSAVGAVAGLYAGGLAGSLSALAKQRREIDSYYNEKKAAYDTLIQEGYDFDTAVELIKQAESN